MTSHPVASARVTSSSYAMAPTMEEFVDRFRPDVGIPEEKPPSEEPRPEPREEPMPMPIPMPWCMKL